MNNGKMIAPRRGSKTTMLESTIVLAPGEIFIEDDTTNGVFRIKIGDGTTQYSSLGYAFSGSSENIKFNPGLSDLTSTNVQDAIIELANSGTSGLCFGTCSTAASTAAKDITVSADQNFELAAGATVVVKFTNTNTASNVTLSVNSGDADSIYYDGAVYTGSDPKICGKANSVVIYSFDGTNWIWIGHGSADSSWVGTQSAYDAIVTKDPNTNYFVTPDPAPSNNEE